MIPKECKRLAEVDFPIAVVSAHSAREKSYAAWASEHASSVVGAAAAGGVPRDATRAAAARSLRRELSRQTSRRRRGRCWRRFRASRDRKTSICARRF